LIELLKHRDDAMKLNAAAALERIVMQGGDKEKASAVELLRKNALRSLLDILSKCADNEQLLLKTIILVINTLNGSKLIFQYSFLIILYHLIVP
jgi:DUF1009 family protein